MLHSILPSSHAAQSQEVSHQSRERLSVLWTSLLCGEYYHYMLMIIILTLAKVLKKNLQWCNDMILYWEFLQWHHLHCTQDDKFVMTALSVDLPDYPPRPGLTRAQVSAPHHLSWLAFKSVFVIYPATVYTCLCVLVCIICFCVCVCAMSYTCCCRFGQGQGGFWNHTMAVAQPLWSAILCMWVCRATVSSQFWFWEKCPNFRDGILGYQRLSHLMTMTSWFEDSLSCHIYWYTEVLSNLHQTGGSNGPTSYHCQSRAPFTSDGCLLHT